jgi:MerR family transcriptional regulator, thiopeptide resistance regulator
MGARPTAGPRPDGATDRGEAPTHLLPVGEVARLAGVSVRTLHHYDEIGLVRPGRRSPAGFRLYDGGDVDRLQAVLAYRELGLPLARIRRVLDDPGADVGEHLLRQRDLLLARIDRLRRVVAAIEGTLEERTMGTTRLTPQEKLEVFGGFDPDEHAAEAEERWGGTDAWAESTRRTARYGARDWRAMAAEQAEADAAMVAALRAGLPATSEPAMDAAESARALVDRWFYPCGHEQHRALADMYVSDPRFTATYEEREPGLAGYTRDAVHANADRHAGDDRPT